jgi:hypothetical protein
MSDIPTWSAILQQWLWFAAAAAVFVVAIGLLMVLKPNANRQPETVGIDPDRTGWSLTQRIDFTDDRAVGELVLQVEESRSIVGSTGLEHREIRWRKATVEEAKAILRSYNSQHNLAMTVTYAVTEAGRTGGGRNDELEGVLRDGGNAQDMSNATLIPHDTQH